jgi:cyanophycinase-like exopeptidase
MTRAGPLHWRTGSGWLVLAGGGDWREGEMGEVDAAVLGWADLTNPIAVLAAGRTSVAEAEALLEYYVDLGGPNGSVVSIHSRSDAASTEKCQGIAGAGLIVVPDAPDLLKLVDALREQPALDAMGQAFSSGSAVVGIGGGASAFGAWVAGESEGASAEPAWAWLQSTIVQPHFQGTESAGWLRRLLRQHPDCLGVGVPTGGALGLGPGGDVVTVGSFEVTVVLGAQRKEQPD